MFLQHSVYQPLIGGPNVLQPKRHHLVTVRSLSSHEQGLLLVARFHSNLIIAQESVHETELVTSSCVHYEVDPRQGKAIFRESPVNIGKVNAKSPLSICLLDENHISQPVGIIYFSDSSGFEEFADLFVDRLLPL